MPPTLSRKQIVEFTDLALLLYLHESCSNPPTLRDIFDGRKSSFNEWAFSRGMDLQRFSPIRSNPQERIEKLRSLGLLEPTGRHVLTHAGRLMLIRLPSNWQNWAMEYPIQENKVVMDGVPLPR